MPIYEFKCLDCSKSVETNSKAFVSFCEKCNVNVLNSMSRVCSSCSNPNDSISESIFYTCDCGGKLKRILSASSFHLKGGGWYKDRYGLRNGS